MVGIIKKNIFLTSFIVGLVTSHGLVAMFSVDPNKPDDDGWTLLHKTVCFVPSDKAYEQVKLLLANGANVNLPDKLHGETAFEMAAAQSKLNIVKLILENSKPKIDIAGKLGKVVVMRAFFDDDLGLLKLLMSYGAVVTGGMARWAHKNLKRKIFCYLLAEKKKQILGAKLFKSTIPADIAINFGGGGASTVAIRKHKRKGIPHKSVKKRKISPQVYVGSHVCFAKKTVRGVLQPVVAMFDTGSVQQSQKQK